jgi:hypothetical protein
MKYGVALAAGVSACLLASLARADAPPVSSATPAPTTTAAPAPAPAPAPAASSNTTPSMTTEPAAKKEEDEDRLIYASFSPLHLIFPIFEAQVEARLHRRIGAAIIGGYGVVKVDSLLAEYKFKVWELGGQIVGYPVGHFDHGMQLGVEVLYAGVSADDTATNSGVTVSGSANGLSFGPIIGYKLATKIGFSFNIQLGAAYLTARAEAKATGGQAASSSQSNFVPILNLNLGWSF